MGKLKRGDEMTLDEAIIHCEEVAKKNEQMAFDLATAFNRETVNSKECKKCANEHRQLAEWLKELKEFRDIKPQLEWDIKKYSKHPEISYVAAFADGLQYVLDMINNRIGEDKE